MAISTPQLTNYSLDQVTIALGPILFDGFQEGDAVTIETPDGFGMVIGGDGRVTRYKTLNRTATVTVKLMQSSAANDLSSGLYNLDVSAPNGAGVAPLFIRDGSGRSIYTAAQAWIQKAPDVTFANEATSREWVIVCAKLVRSDGGN